mgnify:CR=1 FL=1
MSHKNRKPSPKHSVLEELRRAGLIAEKQRSGADSDDDLRIAIKGTEVVLAYLEGRNNKLFDIAIYQLRQNLTELEHCRDMRQFNKKDNHVRNSRLRSR